MKLEIEVMKLRCSKCKTISYHESDQGLVSEDCIACHGNLTAKPTGDTAEAEFEEF